MRRHTFSPPMMASGSRWRAHAGLGLWPHRRRRQGGGAASLSGLAGLVMRRLARAGARLLRASYRTGPDPRGREYRYRRDARAGGELASGDADRQGSAYWIDADAKTGQCRPRHGADHPACRRDRLVACPACGGAVGHCDVWQARATSFRARLSSPSISGTRSRR